MHRADLQQLLVDAVREAGVSLQADAGVTGIDAGQRMNVQLSNGDRLESEAEALLVERADQLAR